MWNSKSLNISNHTINKPLLRTPSSIICPQNREYHEILWFDELSNCGIDEVKHFSKNGKETTHQPKKAPEELSDFWSVRFAPSKSPNIASEKAMEIYILTDVIKQQLLHLLPFTTTLFYLLHVIISILPVAKVFSLILKFD